MHDPRQSKAYHSANPSVLILLALVCLWGWMPSCVDEELSKNPPLPVGSLLRFESVSETGQDKTGQDKTRQDMTRQDKTRQDKTRQDKTRQDRTRQDRTRQTGKADQSRLHHKHMPCGFPEQHDSPGRGVCGFDTGTARLLHMQR